MCFYATRANLIYVKSCQEKVQYIFCQEIISIEICFTLQAGKLNEAERKEKVEPLLAKGWTVVTGRDAIYKEITFKDFNQVKPQAYPIYLVVVVSNEFFSIRAGIRFHDTCCFAGRQNGPSPGMV